MSDEPAFRRIVVICDATSDILPAVSEAAALAARCGVALHGIFLEDENLRRLAELPFGQQVSLSSGASSEILSVAKMASLSAALAAGMRRAIAAAAGKEGVEWSFGSTRDLSGALAADAASEDMLFVEGATRSFSGAWSPPSSFHARACEFTTSVLVRRRGSRGSGVIIVLPPAPKRLAALAEIAKATAEGAEEIVLVAADAKAAAQLAALIDKDRKSRIEKPDRNEASLAARIASRNPRLVIVDAEEDESGLAQALLAVTRSDLLILR